MFEPLTLETLTKHVEMLVCVYGRDHRYSNERDFCYYDSGPNGTGCIIGEALVLAGMSREEVGKLSGTCLSAEQFEGHLFANSETRVYANEIQGMQDDSATWGECLDYLKIRQD